MMLKGHVAGSPKDYMSMHTLTENNMVLYIKEGWPTGGLLSHFVPSIYEKKWAKICENFSHFEIQCL
jgi:hypothetical protein